MTNLKLVLRTYSALRQMSPDDIALLETLRALNDGDRELMVETMAGKPTTKKASKTTPRKIQHCAVCDWTKRAALHKDATRDDYHEFVTSQPEPKPSEQRPSKSATKSERASGMAAQLKERRGQRGTSDDSDDDNRFDGKSAQYARKDFLGGDHELCTRMVGGEIGLEPCEQPADHNIHHLKLHPGYHEFQSGKFTAPPAPAPSPANGGAESGAVSSEIAKDAASSAHHAGG